MKQLNKKINIGTFVKVEGIAKFCEITEINEIRNLFKIKGYDGSWQSGHIIKFKNKNKDIK